MNNMTCFTFEIENPNQQFIQISAELQTDGEETLIELPRWRPGRYELGNFARNVRSFKVFDDKNHVIPATKISKDTWRVDSSGTARITVKYQYYANQLNAGSTYLDRNQLYVNPVNCCVYSNESFGKEVRVILKVPAHWDIATSMQIRDKDLYAANFEELFDSPFVASPQLQHGEYMSGETKFHVWFNGESKPDWDKVLHDFKAFTDKQIEKFIEFPVKEYHFINQIVPYRTYHGVEHLRSTVIALGPSYDIFGDVYSDLLGVSSHELYHAWNVKAIRPFEMFPYNYKSENYSRLGYIYEGVTTYHGDLFLFKSGVFGEKEYFKEFNSQLQKHFDNPGRFNYSVASSSYDTWLDGYEPGVPGRKVSIYTEGCLLAFVSDVRLRRATANKYGLDEAMKRLYHNFALAGKPIMEQDYKSILESISGESWDDFFENYINGCKSFESIITESLEYLGLEMEHVPSESYCEAKLGFKHTKSGKDFSVRAMYPGGPAETGGLMLDDVIIAINGFSCEGEIEKWMRYFEDDTKTLSVLRSGTLLEITLPEVNRNFYMKYSINKLKEPNSNQLRAYEAWRK